MPGLRIIAVMIAIFLFGSIALEAATATRRAPVRTKRTYIKKRSKAKSAAIVGGSAATGAAIGALAGGRKGAGIGAIAGGAGGFIYDRHTHKKRVTQ